MRVILAALSLAALSACSSGPCTDESADKAGAYFAQCMRGKQVGDGGIACGKSAYALCKIAKDD